MRIENLMEKFLPKSLVNKQKERDAKTQEVIEKNQRALRLGELAVFEAYAAIGEATLKRRKD